MKRYAFIILFSVLSLSQGICASQDVPGSSLSQGSAGNRELLQASSSAEFRTLLQAWIGGEDNRKTEKRGPLTGLIDYLTDHMQAEQRNEGWQYRKNIMLDYQSYAVADNEISLKECTFGNDDTAGTICAGKGTMVFQMLRDITGDDLFFDTLRQFIRENSYSQTSWADIRTAFEKASGKSLEWFFSQWVDRKGLPDIEIQDERVTVVRGKQTVSFDVVQKGEVYRFALPVTLKTNKGEVTQVVHVGKEQETFDITVEGTPQEMLFDRDYRVLRKLSGGESPPLIAGLLGDNKKLLILSEGEDQKYLAFIEALKKAGFSAQDAYAIRDEDIRSHSLLILGYEGPVVKRLFGHIDKPASGFALSARKNPLNNGRAVVIAYADAAEDIPSLEAVLQSGRFSHVRFRNGENVHTTTDAASRGIAVHLYKPVLTIQPEKLTRLQDDIETILTKPIIYVGERHMNYEDHKTQLEIIMNLHERGRAFAIGMEMFQRPFQKDINDYLAGSLSEKEFLKRTQYFKRWQFDYNLYREIIEYAKAKQIPVVGLNIWTEIIKKVSADGLDGLTDIERSELPRSMDMSDDGYRERLGDVFRQHKSREGKSFENFYQAQILWDETMAQSIDEFLKKNPGYQMVVLAGAGHLMYGSGIPKRAYRLNKKDYVIILPGGEYIDTRLGDYLVTPEPLSPPTTLKLGVILKERDGHIEIEKVVPGSVAKSVGLEKGDILLSLNDWRIEDIDDVNIFMSDKKRGEQVTIKVLRKKFLVGYREVVLSGTI